MSTNVSLADLAKKVTEVATTVSTMKAKLDEVDKANGELRKSLPGAPFVRKGESALTSRGYSYAKLFQLMNRQIDPSEAKVESDYHEKLRKRWVDRHGAAKSENSILVPFASEFLPQDTKEDRDFAQEVQDVVKAGIAGYDPDEARHTLRRVFQKTLSWTDDSALGSLVPPPQFGELIDVLRPNEVLMAAGCRTIPLPPNGRILYPRQTGVSTFYHVGENQQITASEQTTGDVIIQAKKGAVLVKLPNELFRYASISVEAFVRQDMMKTVALGVDKQLLEGTGSSIAPKGLINYAAILSYTSTGTPADGNSGYPLQPEDVVRIVMTVEEVNAEFKGFIMRPSLFAWLVNRRSDAVTAGDGKGQFVFNIWRDLSEHFDTSRSGVPMLNGYPVHKSTQISNTRTRGSGTTNNSYILGGNFDDYILALSPTIEFAQTNQGDTPFQYDQTWMRLIFPYDGAPRREASFVLCDNLLTS